MITPRPLREPAVAGMFYPGEPSVLRRDVERLVTAPSAARPAVAVVVPHAGYVYSGAIAGRTYAEVVVPRRAIVLCPNHTGLGVARSVWPSGSWRTPLGDVPVDAALASRLVEEAGLEPDREAHLGEHAVEVQLPLLLRARERTLAAAEGPAAQAGPPLSVVPICLAGLSFEECRSVGRGLARAIAGADDVLLVASTDMSHYISAARARVLDDLALRQLLALDGAGLYGVVERNGLTMCGFIPTTVVVEAARALGARKATLVRYGNSGETSGDYERVVGYAGVIIEK
jgi:hypothetical protein